MPLNKETKPNHYIESVVCFFLFSYIYIYIYIYIYMGMLFKQALLMTREYFFMIYKCRHTFKSSCVSYIGIKLIKKVLYIYI